MIYSIFRKKGIAFITFLMLLIGTDAFSQTANSEDYDGDGVPNVADFDDDNDGILDVDEYGCNVDPLDMPWGTLTWVGGSPDDDVSSTSTTTASDGTGITASNAETDFPELANSVFATINTTFNGVEGLLLQAPTAQFLDSVNILRYRVSFDRPVIGLSFRVVDIDLRELVDGDPYIGQVKVTISNQGEELAPIAGTDYTVGSAVTDLGGGFFRGNSWVPGTADIGDVIYTLNYPVDDIFIEVANVDPTTTAVTPGNMAILISNMTWDCAYRDYDNDSLADHFDTDSDADTCSDALEGDGGFTLANLDTDGSLGDVVDLGTGIPTIAGAGQSDVSSTNALVTSGECDDDGDGVINSTDGANSLDACLPVQTAGYTGYDATNAIWAAGDCDGDTILNGDEVTNSTDPYNSDTDGDGINDNLEASVAEALDACLPVQSAGYTGYDSGNATWAAADCDGDGVINGDEATNGTDPYQVSGDTDGDGIDDDNEINNGTVATDPCDPVQAAGYTGYDSGNATWSAADCDGDGVINGDEATNGTDPYQVSGDTDGDGIDDDNEINNGTVATDPCDPVQAAGYTGYDSGNATWSAADCDGDGVVNGDEATNGTDPYQVSGDTDGDGIDDDNEINNGTVTTDPCDPVQAAGYTGYDSGNATWTAADCDGDGVINGDEATNGTDPYQASGDTDGDGIDDDNEINNGTVTTDPCDPVQAAGYTGYDSGNATWAAADCDGDGVINGDEATNGTDPYQASGDTDGDGIDDDNEINNGTVTTDPCDPVQAAGYTGYDSGNATWAAADCDGDGVINGDEATNGTDPYQVSGDTDGDGILDDDEVNNGTDPMDPCDPVQAAGYTGYDAGNSTWAAADCDGDGITNGDEATNGTDPYEASGDTDGDGISDDDEVNNGTDPMDPCDPVQSPGYTGYDATNAIWAASDCDADNLTNSEEVALGTDVYNADTDGDTINDGQEVTDGTNPFDDCDSLGGTPLPNTFCDRDSDGLSDDDEADLGTDPDNPDSDGDTIEDGQEVTDGTDPLDACDSEGGTPPQGIICGVEIGNSIVTPDGDGINDVFRIENIELFTGTSVEIINRWGTLVFKTENYDNNSNAFGGIANTGTSLNKGSVLPAGVYFYIIKYVDEGERRNESGYLYINQ